MDWWTILIALLRPWSSSADDRWAAALGRLDVVRAEAFATSDPGLLDEVYLRGSPLRSADARVIRDYAARDATVIDAQMQVLSCRLLSSSARRARLHVVDRLGAASVRWADGSSRTLPHDRPTRRTVTLVQTSGGWRIAGSEETA